MKVLAARFWSEQEGFLLSAEAVLYATIVVIGLIAGLSSVRDSVVTELADVAQAIANLNQTYSFGAVVGHCGFSGGSSFIDLTDFCDVAAGGTTAQQSKCVAICSDVTVAGNPSAGESGT